MKFNSTTSAARVAHMYAIHTSVLYYSWCRWGLNAVRTRPDPALSCRWARLKANIIIILSYEFGMGTTSTIHTLLYKVLCDFPAKNRNN